MYPRNAASPPRIAIGPVVQISDGAVQTSGVSVKVKPTGSTASAGGGTISYEEGIVEYAPTQGETDYTAFEVIAYKTGCIPVAVTVVTTASATSGRVLLSGETHTSAVIPTVTTLANAPSDSSGVTTLLSRLSSARAGYLDNINNANLSSVPAFPANFASLGINASGHVSRVVLCDTITTYTGNTPQTGDSFARIGATGSGLTSLAPAATALSTATWTATRAGYLDNLSAGAVMLASSYSAPPSAATVATAVRTELGTELGRIDVATSTRLASSSYTAAPSASTVASQVRTELTSELLVMTRLGTAIELDGAVYRYTANALELAPSSSGGDATAANQVTIINHLTAIKGGGFSGSTDSLEAISDAVAALSVSSGSGAFTVTITVNDGSTVLQGAIVRVSEGVTTISGTTNASGVATFALDAATWSLAITKPGYSFTPTTLAVSGNTTTTRSMTAVTPGAPAAPGLSTGTIVCYGTNGLPESGAKVTVQLVSGPGDAGSALDGAALELTANGSGVATHNGFVRGAAYKARRGTSGAWVRFVVPDSDSFDLSELVGSP